MYVYKKHRKLIGLTPPSDLWTSNFPKKAV